MQPWEFLQVQQIAVIALGIVSLFFFIVFFFPGLAGGFYAGSRILGVYNGILMIIASFIFCLIIGTIPLSFYSIDLLPVFLNFSPVLFSLNILTGYFGGYLRERFRLWAIKGEELSEKVKNQITIFIKKTFPTKISYDSWPSD